MQPLLSDPEIALPLVPNDDPCDEITEEDIVFDSTLVAPTGSSQRETFLTDVSRENTDVF